jgi:hypothetical protein
MQILKELYLQGNEIGDEGAQYLGEALQKNTVREREINRIFIFTIFIFIISYRHSQHFTSSTIKLEMKVHSILVKDYKRTQ